MRYCNKCGQMLAEGAAFCGSCGAPVESELPAPVVLPVVNEKLIAEERAFLETTHRLLRWEYKAWSIASKVFIIMGIVFTAVFMLFCLIGLVAVMVSEDSGGEIAMVMGILYATVYGVMFIALGIVNKKAGQKLPQYINTVCTDFSLTYNRCGSVGMLVFCILFGAVSAIFFIINFARMKANRAVIERILRNQGVHA